MLGAMICDDKILCLLDKERNSPLSCEGNITNNNEVDDNYIGNESNSMSIFS